MCMSESGSPRRCPWGPTGSTCQVEMGGRDGLPLTGRLGAAAAGSSSAAPRSPSPRHSRGCVLRLCWFLLLCWGRGRARVH